MAKFTQAQSVSSCYKAHHAFQTLTYEETPHGPIGLIFLNRTVHQIVPLRGIQSQWPAHTASSAPTPTISQMSDGFLHPSPSPCLPLWKFTASSPLGLLLRILLRIWLPIYCSFFFPALSPLHSVSLAVHNLHDSASRWV